MSTKLVSPVGTAVANGTALLNAIASIAPTAASPWLVKIEPGIYDLGAGQIGLKSNMDIEGSGQAVTIIKSANNNTAVLAISVTAAEVRHLTVEVSGAADMRGFWIINASLVTLTHVTINSTSSGSQARGVFTENGSASAILQDVSITTINTNAAAANSNALTNQNSTGLLWAKRVTINATGGAAIFSRGLFNNGGTVRIDDSDISVSGGGAANYAENNLGTVLLSGTRIASGAKVGTVTCAGLFAVFTDLSTAVERSGSAPGLGPSEWDEQWPTSVSGAASVRRACRVLAEGPI